MKILVVEDNKAVQGKLLKLLTLQGYDVYFANNGLDALEKVQQRNYQLFVIDHLMPLMNGVQLVKNLKKSLKLFDIKIIFMTTQGSYTLKRIPEFILFDKIIDKPINEDMLLNLVSELTANSYAGEARLVNV
jgi:two-component system chemotaxis response regulator CheY